MAETEDFIDYGFEPEFIGRLPVRVACTPLDENSLFQILKKSEGSLINQYTHSFRSYGIDLKFEDEALKELARMAAKEKTGARAFLTIFEKVFRDYKFEMPSIDIDCLVVTREVVLDPKLKLRQILETLTCEHSLEISQIREFEKEFKSIHHMHIKFDQAACKQICETTSSSSVNIKEYCWKLLQSYEYGLKLIKQNTGKSSFNLGDEVVTNPKLALERMVKESYVGQ
jgi:hypothetical protein